MTVIQLLINAITADTATARADVSNHVMCDSGRSETFELKDRCNTGMYSGANIL